jgi:hypothetical protein
MGIQVAHGTAEVYMEELMKVPKLSEKGAQQVSSRIQ